MAQGPVERTEEALDRLLAELASHAQGPPPGAGRTGPDVADSRAVWRAMVTSRALDVAARRLKAQGRGYYTISSAGHEANALVGHVLRPTDPAFLHYRSGAFVAARRRDDLEGFVRDTVASLQASVDDPVAAGRHKVWGSREAWIPPQTSTIASHLPKAVGAALAIGRAGRVGATPLVEEVGEDAVVCASFGDASLNHATASSGLTMARWARRLGAAVPVLFLCEDNGLGISVRTPRGWVESALHGLPGLRYVRADGDLDARWDAVVEAVGRVRRERTPVALHLPTVRLWGHAGSDLEVGYRTADDIAAAEAADPLLATARWMVATGRATAHELHAERRAAAELVDRTCEQVPVRHATTAAQVEGPLALHVPRDLPRPDTTTTRDRAQARERTGLARPEEAVPAVRRTLGARINAALHDLLLADPRTVAFGEDVAVKGGVYGVTAGLQARFGPDRVFDTMLDETAILGAAQGFGLLGYLPIPEIQYLAYLHNALDQLRGEACSTAWLSNGAFTSPMVLRVAAFAYQKGFGGHFHNDNAIGALRDIPGLVVAAPARGDDAVRLLRGATALARDAGRVVALLEPIALYHERDLYDDGDEGWLTAHPAEGAVLPGQVAAYPAGRQQARTATIAGTQVVVAPDAHDLGAGGEDVRLDDGADLVVATYANGVRMSLRAARRLLEEDGIRVRVLDLRWLSPLPMHAVVDQAREVGRVLVVDECRTTGGGVADAIIAGLVEAGSAAAMASVRARDSYVPLGPAAAQVLVTEEAVVAAARDLARAAVRR